MRLVPVSGPEQHNALQTGAVDAVAATPSAFGGYAPHELATWYTAGFGAGSVHVTLAANSNAHAALPDDMKAPFDEAKAHAYAATIEAQSAAADGYRPDLDKAGLSEILIEPATTEALRAEAAQPVWDAFVEQTEADGLPGISAWTWC